MADDDWARAVDAQESGVTKQVPQRAVTAVTAVTAAGDGASATTSPQAAGSENKDTEGPTSADVSLLNKLLRSQLVSTTADLEVLQRDPKSPLHSIKSFEALNLKPELLKGVYDMGFNAPSKIQETALPSLLADPPQNMIAQSQSGTGKTAAFILTMLMRVDINQSHPQCLCLAPTYELALQIGSVAEQMSKHMAGLQIAYAVRGGRRVERGEKLRDHIIIGTPGTLMDWCMKFRVLDMKLVRVFVLDEADVMIDTQGHQDQSIRIQKGLSKSCQMLLFSATYESRVMKFAQAVVPNPMVIRLRREEESLDNIKQFYIRCRSQEDKFQALSNIYGTISIGQSMIFCRTRKTAGWLTEKMMSEGNAVALLSGELTVEQRAAIIERFRAGKEKVLITTNVSARGIDVEQVTVVVNFDLPVDQMNQADCETYLHRIGRTGRFGKRGIAINMIEDQYGMVLLQAIEKHFGRTISKLDANDFDAIEKIGNS